MNEEGLLRVGCGNSKLKRMKSAIDANMVHLPLQLEYQDVHLIASLLKSYLRSLPEPLLTFKYYSRFISACQMASDAERKAEIFSIIKELKETREDYYTNLRYLMKFLTKLSENHQNNKMSTQNIAIVMSPNLLWSPNDSDEGNYALQVNSTAFGNSIVEMLVADWRYFFGEDNIDFFDTISKDKLLGMNGETVNDTQLGRSVMSSSFNTQKSHASHNSSGFTSVDSSAKKHSHSRGSSYDTSQILKTDQMKESQSNSSLSDHSSPTHGSPKPSNRKKKNAPIPPALTGNFGGEELQFIDCDAEDHKSGKVRAAKSTENLLKPEKPARPPAYNVECQTMGRKNPYSPSKLGEEPFRRQVPVPAVRTSVAVKPGISKSDDEDVILRPTEKPQIPERPQIAKRPASFRGSVSVTTPTDKLNHFETSFSSKPQLNKNNSCPIDDGDVRTFTGNESNVDKKIPTVLERTQVYSIDKQQVAMVDVSSKNSNTPCPPPLPPSGLAKKDGATKSNENKENSQNSVCKFLSSEIQDTNNLMTTSTSSISSDHNPGAVPQSPRSLDGGKLKRPQVPPPARPKSSDGDNTKL